jgi:hypothetical protein
MVDWSADIHPFLSLALVEVSSHLHAPAALPAKKEPRTTGAYWGGCMVPRAGLNIGKEKEKNLLPLSAIELKFLGCQFVL